MLVLEARGRLGGRATAFVDRASGEMVDNGQHLMLGCYRDTLAFLQEIGASGNVHVGEVLSVAMIDRGGLASRLDCGPGPLAMSLAIGLLRWRALSWGDCWSALRVVRPIRAAARGVIDTRVGETVHDWLVRHRQSARMRDMLWEPLALAALNQAPEVASAGPFLRVLGDMFGGRDRRAAALVLPRTPLHQMYAEPARTFVEERGGVVLTGTPAHVRIEAGSASVTAGAEHWRGLPVVVATPWFALPTLFSGDTTSLMPVLQAAAATAASPIATVNLWFDRPVLTDMLVGLPGRTMQWAFDKRQIVGPSVSHLSLVASGATMITTRTNSEIIEDARLELVEAIPAIGNATLVNATVIREPRATFSLAPGQPPRPSTRTAVDGLFLAGDWIETGLPATIESAVRSGHLAAEAVLAWRPSLPTSP